MTKKEINQKTIVALDNFSAPMAEEIIDKWKDEVHGFKLNHTLFPTLAHVHHNIFCDYKLFDIPNTMESVIEYAINKGAKMITVHVNNSPRAMECIAKYSQQIKLLGVTYLTSWDHNDLQFVYNKQSQDIYERAVWLMTQHNFYGMICSPKDLRLLKDAIPKSNKLKKFCPGIRQDLGNLQDQVRVTTAQDALDAGADYIIIGRSFFV